MQLQFNCVVFAITGKYKFRKIYIEINVVKSMSERDNTRLTLKDFLLSPFHGGEKYLERNLESVNDRYLNPEKRLRIQKNSVLLTYTGMGTVATIGTAVAFYGLYQLMN